MDTVLVTGAAGRLGGRVVRALLREPGIGRVVAVDASPPPGGVHGGGIGAAEFVRADLRRPAFAAALAAVAPDTVVHLAPGEAPPGPAGRSAAKEANVIGSMQLLAACTRAPSVQRLVVRSTTGVYGAAAKDPSIRTEEMQAHGLPAGGWSRDSVEIEGYVRGFARRRPDVAVAVLRFADLLGPHSASPLARYFAQPVLPAVLGRDPRLQFVHEDDAVEAVRRAALRPRRGTSNDGTFNVAGAGVLLLSQAARRLGRPVLPLPLPALRGAGQAVRAAGAPGLSGVGVPPDEVWGIVQLLTHGRVVDTTRLRDVFGFTPEYSTPGAFAEFARGRGAGLLAAAARRILGAAEEPGSAEAGRARGAVADRG